MKKVMSKNTILIAIIAVFSAAFTNPAMANAKVDPPITEVKYVGSVEDSPVFELTLKNYQEDNYFITIRDAAGTIIFSEKLTGANISRKYRIDTEEQLSEGGLRFEVRSMKTRKLETYIAGFTENVTREIAVTKL